MEKEKAADNKTDLLITVEPMAIKYGLLFWWFVAAACSAKETQEEKRDPEPTEVRVDESQNTHVLFGRQQLLRLLGDRPAMKSLIEEGDWLWEWAEQQFSGSDTGFRVQWDSGPPKSGQPAEFRRPEGSQYAFIRIRRGLGFDLGWRSFVYQFTKLRTSARSDTIKSESLSGSLDRSQWIRQNTQLEFEAIRKTATFWVEKFSKYAVKRGFTTNRRSWFVGYPSNHADWIARYQGTRYPEDPWGVYYDEKIAPYLERSR